MVPIVPMDLHIVLNKFTFNPIFFMKGPCEIYFGCVESFKFLIRGLCSKHGNVFFFPLSVFGGDEPISKAHFLRKK